jgi:thiol peroxidase
MSVKASPVPLVILALLVLGLAACQPTADPTVTTKTDADAGVCPPGAEGIAQVIEEMPTRPAEVTLRGEPLTLIGEAVEEGDQAPSFVAVAQDLTDKRLTDYAGKVLIVASVPSLDTGVCSKQTKTFNEQAAALGDQVTLLTVSMDLPFAQKRWCGAEGVEEVVTLSDYRHWSFGLEWGLRIKESGLLARSVYVVDPAGTVRYREIVSELTQEPDYEAALGAAKKLIQD